jgi:hypothetical protein
MTMNPRVTAVSANDNYTLELTFANGEVGFYDCAPLLSFGVFQELQDLAYFKQVRAEGGTAVWPHEQDICPDTLYEDSQKKLAVPANLQK